MANNCERAIAHNAHSFLALSLRLFGLLFLSVIDVAGGDKIPRKGGTMRYEMLSRAHDRAPVAVARFVLISLACSLLCPPALRLSVRAPGPGITQADLLVINKTDLAEAVGADLKLMASQVR